LADSSAGLFGGHVFQTRRVQAEPSAAKTDGTGRDQNDVAVIRLQSGDSPHNRLDALEGKLTLGTRNGARTQLNDQTLGAAQEVISGLIRSFPG